MGAKVRKNALPTERSLQRNFYPLAAYFVSNFNTEKSLELGLTIGLTLFANYCGNL
jgi:hypothetical protein